MMIVKKQQFLFKQFDFVFRKILVHFIVLFFMLSLFIPIY